MPLKMGYTPEILGNNITEFVKLGYLHKNAINIALAVARDSYRVEHPTGKFPKHLQGAGKFYRENPVSEKTAHKLRKAAPRTFEKMTDEEIKKAVKVSAKPSKRRQKNPIEGTGIVTKYIPPSNVKGARIKVYRSGDAKISKTYSYPHELSGSDAHEAVAKAFMTHLGWSGTLSGAETDTGYFFVVHKVRQSSVRAQSRPSVDKNPVRPLKTKKRSTKIAGSYYIGMLSKGVRYFLTPNGAFDSDIAKAVKFTSDTAATKKAVELQERYKKWINVWFKAK